MMDNFYFYGSEVKATDNGVVKGYAIRFGSPGDHDLENDYFSATETDFGRPLKIGDSFKMNTYYHHAQDKVLKTTVIGSGVATMDDKGIWFEAQLDLSNEYGAMINELVKQGKLGYSSGSTSHLVTRERKGNSYLIKSWPISEISLTPSPAEPRNVVIKSIKGMMDGMEGMDSESEEDNIEEMVEGLIELGVSPDDLTTSVFDGYDKELVSQSIHYLFEKLCSGLYSVLEEGNDISYVNNLIDGFAVRAKDVASKIYESPANEMMMLKLYSGHKPETIRDLEKRLRDVGYSNGQSKALAGVVWSHLRDGEVIKTENPEKENIKMQLLKRALLDLI